MSAPDRIRADDLAPGDRVWHPFDLVCFTVADKPKPETGLHFQGEPGLRVTGTSDRGETVHVDVAPGYIWFRAPVVGEAEEPTVAAAPASATTREELLAKTRKHLWAAWSLSPEELASQAAATLLRLGMLVPEGGAAELEQLRARIAELEALLAEYERPVDEDPIAYALTPAADAAAVSGACKACGSVPDSWCPACGACQQGCYDSFKDNPCTHEGASWTTTGQRAQAGGAS